MAKIRIPRKKKKPHVWRDVVNNIPNWFPNITKLERYYAYFTIEYAIKKGWVELEPYVKIKKGPYIDDNIVWWHWVRKKHLGIEPKMSKEFQEYWDYFVKKGVIKF